jgi:SNF2 family DNA or RNA helicase
MISKAAMDNYFNQKLDDWRWVKELSRKDALEYIKENVPKEFKFKTKPFIHQLVGFIIGIHNPKFLWFLDMGTGKSKLVLDLLNYYKLIGKINKILILVPSPVGIGSFIEQIEMHSDFSYESLYGIKNERWNILERTKADICIMNYAGLRVMLMGEKNEEHISLPSKEKIIEFSKYFDAVVWDEIHALQNMKTLTYRLSVSFTHQYPVKYGLTGTPVGRDPMDLWTQFHVIDNGETLGRVISIYREAFFDTKVNYWGGYEYKFKKTREKQLQRRLCNKSLRYAIEEVIDLPEKIYRRINVKLSTESRGYYKSIVEGLIALKGNFVEIDAVFVRLRQICSGFLQHNLDDEKVIIDFDYNTKLEALMDLVDSIPLSSKIIIFHEFIHSGNIISKELKKNKYKHERLFGGTKDKIGAKNRFTNEKDIRIFVVNSKSGGTSLNLQVANYIIYFESPVSPKIRVQSEGRAYRTGQTKHTFIYDLVVKGSIEEKVLDYLAEGKDIFKALIKGEVELE